MVALRCLGMIFCPLKKKPTGNDIPFILKVVPVSMDNVIIELSCKISIAYCTAVLLLCVLCIYC